MDRRQISLAHLTVLDTTPPELVSVAAAAGFRTVGIRLTATPSVGIPPYDILSDGPLLRETVRRLADTGVSVLDAQFLRFEPEHPVGVPEGFLEVSARLGARNVLVMSAEPEEARTIERFGELCDRAAPYGLHVCLEFAIYTGSPRSPTRRASCSGRSAPTRRCWWMPWHFSRSVDSRPRRTGRSGALPVRPDLRRLRGHARPRDTPALIREARTAAASRRGQLPLAELVAALPDGLPLAVEAASRATAGSARPRWKRAHRAPSALVGG
jgi:hypothetical protein